MKKVGSKLRRELLSYLEVREVYELANIDEMSKELQTKLKDGKIILNKLKQYKFSPRTKEEMINDYQFLINKTEESPKENSPQNDNTTNNNKEVPDTQENAN